MTESTNESRIPGKAAPDGKAPAMVQAQVELPFRIALGIVMQGFRIRLGRSLITVAGVVLGVAFITANVTNQIARAAVREEESIRAAARRMASFLTAETGPVAGKTFGVVQTGPLTSAERRFVNDLARSGLAHFNWWTPESLPAEDMSSPVAVKSPLDQVAQGVRAVLMLGAGVPETPAAADTAENAALREAWEVLSRVGPEIVIASTIGGDLSLPETLGPRVIRIERDPTPEQIEKAQIEGRRARFRGIWIICISILVTVMSITNAMLMSVTERFREIGTMKCLGAKSSFIRRLFLIESSITGLVGGVAGMVAGMAFSLFLNAFIYGFSMMWSLNYPQLLLAAVSVVLGGCILAIIAAINPANVAASMTPSHALRSNV